MQKAYLQASAQSFGAVNAVQSACYYYLIDYNDKDKQTLHSYYTTQVRQAYPKLKDKYIDMAVGVALFELSYPTLETQAWSVRERSAVCGLPKSTWSRLKLSSITDRIITHIMTTSDTVQSIMHHQICGNGRLLDKVMTHIAF